MTNPLQIAVATALIYALASTATAAPQPIDHFARRPQMSGATISADGRYIAFLSGSGDETLVMTFDRTQPGNAFKRIAASEPDNFDLAWCRWANEQRVLCSVYGNDRGNRYAEPPFKRLFAVDANGTALKSLQQSRDEGNTLVGVTSARNFQPTNYSTRAWQKHGDVIGPLSFDPDMGAPERQDEIVDLTPDEPDDVLIQLDDDHDSFRSIYQLNIYSGRRGQRFPEFPPIQQFVTDGRGNPRLGWGTQDLETHYFARLKSDREWRRLGVTRAFSATNPLRPIAMAAGADSAYALGAHEGRDALWSIDLTDKRAPKLLLAHPLVDVGAPLLQADRRLLGVRYEVERPYVWYADPKLRALIDRLEQQSPGRFFEIIDSSQDMRVLLIQSSNDVDAGTYYVYDVEKEKLQKLGAAYPELDPASLGTMRHIVYKASDGTSIPGYLTVPGVETKNLPLIVMPHDGPAARDSWKFSFLRTFLANRGYAVLQMNYRGSAGFGAEWQLDAHQDWGGVIQSDIQDATRWAVKEGIADPQRICIMGWGFGGYAALLGAARDSGQYRCAVSIAGISDLQMYQEHGSISGEEEFRRAQVGEDREKITRSSPVALAAKMNVPVMLIHGTKDWRVQVDQTHAMARALEKAGKPHDVVIIRNGSHELERKSDRTSLLEAVEVFLNTNLDKGAAQ